MSAQPFIRQQNAVVIDNLIDLTSYELGDASTEYGQAISTITVGGPPSSAQFSSQAAAATTTTTNNNNNSGPADFSDQYSSPRATNSSNSNGQLEQGAAHLGGEELDLLSEAGMLSEAAVRGPPSPSQRTGVGVGGGGGAKLADFPENLSLGIRDDERRDAVSEAPRNIPGPSPRSGIIRLDTILDPEEEKRRERVAARRREWETASPEPIPATPSLEADYYSSRGRSVRSTYSVASSTNGDVDGILSEAAVRDVRTPELIPTSPSLDMSRTSVAPKRDYIDARQDLKRSVPNYVDTVSSYSSSPKRDNRDFVGRAPDLREKQHSPEPIPATPSLETELYTVMSSPQIARGNPINQSKASEESESSGSASSDKPHWSRVSVTKLPPTSPKIATIPSQSSHETGSGVIDVEKLGESLHQTMRGTESTVTTSAASSFDGEPHKTQSMYRRAILARKRKSAAARAVPTTTSAGSFKPILSRGSEETSESTQLRSSLRDKYRSIVISEDQEESSSFRFDDDEIKLALGPTVSSEQGSAYDYRKGRDLTPVLEKRVGQNQNQHQMEAREEAESRSRMTDEKRENEIQVKASKEKVFLANSKSSMRSVQSVTSGTEKARLPLQEQQHADTNEVIYDLTTGTVSDGLNIRAVHSAEVYSDAPDIPKVMSAPNQMMTDYEDDSVPDIQRVLSEPRKKSRVSSMDREHVIDSVVNQVTKAISKDRATKIEAASRDSDAEEDAVKEVIKGSKSIDSASRMDVDTTVVNSEEAFLHMRKVKHIRLEMKEFNEVVSPDGGEDIQDDDMMQQSVMELVNNDDEDEHGKAGAPITTGYSRDLAISDDSTTTDEEKGDGGGNAADEVTEKKKKTVEFVDLPSPSRVPERKAGILHNPCTGTIVQDSQDEGVTSGEDNSKYSSDENGKFSSDENGAESDSKVSIITELSYSADELDPELDPHVLYDSEAMHFVVQMLDRSCAWLEDDGLCNDNQGPSLLREIKKKSRYETAVSEKTADRRRSSRSRDNQKKPRIVGKAPAALFRKTSKQVNTNPVVQQLGNPSRVQEVMSSDTDPNDTDEPNTNNNVSIFARPRRKRPPSPRKKKKNSPKNNSLASPGSPKAPDSPTRRKRSKSPRKRSQHRPLDLVPLSPQPQDFEPPVSPFQKKLQERLDKVRTTSEYPKDLDVPDLSENLPSPPDEPKKNVVPAAVSAKQTVETFEIKSTGSQTPSVRPGSPPKDIPETRSSSPKQKGPLPPSSYAVILDVTEVQETQETGGECVSNLSPHSGSPDPPEATSNIILKSSSSPAATPSSRVSKRPPQARKMVNQEAPSSHSPKPADKSALQARVDQQVKKSVNNNSTKQTDAPGYFKDSGGRSPATNRSESNSKARVSFRKSGLTIDTNSGVNVGSSHNEVPSAKAESNNPPTPSVHENNDDVNATGSDNEDMSSDIGSESTGSTSSSRRAFGGPEAHSASRTTQHHHHRRSNGRPQSSPSKESNIGGSSGHFVNRLETIPEVNDTPSPIAIQQGGGQMDYGSGAGGGDPFDGLTEEERMAALELAEKLRRRAATLKRRRRAREQRFKDLVVNSEGEEEEEISYATGMSYASGTTSYNSGESGYSYGSYGGSANSYRNDHHTSPGRKSSYNHRETVKSSV